MAEPMTTGLERLLTPAEAARVIGVSVHTLSWWRRHRKGPNFLRVGRHARYRPADIRAYLNLIAVITTDGERASRVAAS